MASNKGRAIILFGLDGSGKSTQAQMMIEHASKSGLPASYVWLRVPWKASLPLMALNRIACVSRKFVSADGKVYTRTELWRSPFLSRLWKSWLLFTLRAYSNLKIRKPIRQGKLVVVDRYVFDALVDYVIDNNDDSLVDKLWHEFAGIIPEQSTAFYLDISAEAAMLRKPGEDAALLERRRKLYLGMAKKYGAHIIDATLSADEIHKTILKACML